MYCTNELGCGNEPPSLFLLLHTEYYSLNEKGNPASTQISFKEKEKPMPIFKLIKGLFGADIKSYKIQVTPTR
jgi:hypothetical protein